MFHVYIMASRRNGTLYIGSTDNLNRRVFEYQTGAIPGFTRRYGVKMLVWHEAHESRESAFLRERAMKTWNPSLEASPDRGAQSGVARPRARLGASSLQEDPCWLPAFAGMSGLIEPVKQRPHPSQVREFIDI